MMRRRIIAYLAVALFILCPCLLGPVVEGLVLAVFGWPVYLWHAVHSIDVDPAGFWTAAICLVLLVGGLHGFLRWLASNVTRPSDLEAVAPLSCWRFRWTANAIAIVLMMFVAGIAGVGLVHQTIWLFTSTQPLIAGGSVREAASRIGSSNNLHQLALAVHAHLDEHHDQFPPGGLFDKKGQGLHGWPTLLLPYLEHEKLYRRIDLQIPWNDPANAGLFETEIKAFYHPAVDEHADANGFALIHYAGNVRLIGTEVAMSRSEVADGLANTILFGEVVSDFKPWGFPANWRDPALGLDRVPEGFGGPSKGGVQFAFADGSVRLLSREISTEVLKALSTPAGGEQIDVHDLP